MPAAAVVSAFASSAGAAVVGAAFPWSDEPPHPARVPAARAAVSHKAYEKILVFLSSSRKYVFEAYDVEAFHYLVKPVDQEKLKNILRRAAEKGRELSQDYIVISRERQKRKLFLDTVRYFEIRGRQIDVHEEKGIFTYYEQMGVLEKQLQGKGFFRCHKSYLLNLKYVEGYNRQEAILDNGERIIIAKRRYEEFCQAILAYMRKNGGIL